MDSLKTLLEQKKYDLVIKLTERSESATDLFYRISAFIYLGKYEDALYVIQDHQSVLENNLVTLINAHINLLCALGRFDQAYTVLDYYNNLPYQSQIVEETLRKMPQVIALEEKKQQTVRYYDDEQLEEYLRNGNNDEVLLALDTIRKRDIFTFLPYIEEVMVNNPKQLLRSYSLMLLVQKEVDRPLKMKSLDEIIEVNPKHIAPPFTNAIFNETVKLFEKEYKDPTLAQWATQLFSEYEMLLYPRSIKDSPKDLAAAFYIISRKMSGSDTLDVEEYCLTQGVDSNKIKELVIKIEDILDRM